MKPLSRSYEIPTTATQDEENAWVVEAARHGSRTALRELEISAPFDYEDARKACNFSFEPKDPTVLNYKQHVEPFFDFGNVELLHDQLTSWSNVETETEDQVQLTNEQRYINATALSSDADDCNPGSPYVFGSLLHLAALFGFHEAVVTLLDFGFNINAVNMAPAIRTPLLCALKRGHTEIARTLINRGANCKQLVFYSNEDYFSITPSPLHYLVNIENEREAVRLAQELVKRGADVNYKCEVVNMRDQTPTDFPVLKGRSVTPLRWAVIHQKAKLVRTLLNLGAKFAYEEYSRPSETTDGTYSKV